VTYQKAGPYGLKPTPMQNLS